MKKFVAAAVVGLFAMVTLAGPAAAYRVAGRSNVSGLFRDIEVCADGIRFDSGTQDVGIGDLFENYPVGSIPDAPRIEKLYITSDPTPLFDSPSNDLTPTPFTVLLGAFDVAPIANNDPYILASNLTTPTQRLFWNSTYSEPWSTVSGDNTLAVGTELYVYSEEGGPPPAGEHPSIEKIVVSDCLLFPCEAEGAIVGTNRRNILIGTSGDDIICGLGGNDLILGRGGNDTILGGDGRDVLIGGSGNDKIFGENGKDKLIGNQGDDMLDGGSGRDRLYGNSGNDMLTGGPGADKLFGGSGADVLTQ